MKYRKHSAMALLLVALPLAPVISMAQEAGNTPAGRWEKSVPQIAQGPWQGRRLSDGQPDVQGFWSNTIANHNNWTDPQAGSPDEPTAAAKLPRSGRAPSRVSDPADGQVPYQPWARTAQQDFAAHFANPTESRYIEPLARCAPAGVPKSFTWHGYEIRQYPGVVLFLFNSGSRLVYLDGRPPLPGSIKLWNADSRGRWEDNTLVVQVRNNNAKALFARTGDFASENVQIEERFVFENGGKRYNYVATFTDPSTYTRPWTAIIPARRYTEADQPEGWHYDVSVANRAGAPVHEHMERICVENNGPFGGGAVGVPSDAPVIAR